MSRTATENALLDSPLIVVVRHLCLGIATCCLPAWAGLSIGCLVVPEADLPMPVGWTWATACWLTLSCVWLLTVHLDGLPDKRLRIAIGLALARIVEAGAARTVESRDDPAAIFDFPLSATVAALTLTTVLCVLDYVVDQCRIPDSR